MIGRKGPFSSKSTLSHDFSSSYLQSHWEKKDISTKQERQQPCFVYYLYTRLLTNFVEKKRALKAAQSLWESSVLSDKPGLPSPYTIN